MEGFPDSSIGKESACNAGGLGSIPGLGRYPEEGKSYHSSILACRIPWTWGCKELDMTERLPLLTESGLYHLFTEVNKHYISFRYSMQ